MQEQIQSPAASPVELSLYVELGKAWFAEFNPDGGAACHGTRLLEVGRREIRNLLPALRQDLRSPHPEGVAACVAKSIQRCASWPMPTGVVSALAMEMGLGLSDDALTRLFNSECMVVGTQDDRFAFVPNLADHGVNATRAAGAADASDRT